MAEHIFAICCLAAMITMAVCSLIYYLFKNSENVFDELSEDEIKEFDDMGSTVNDIIGNTNIKL